MSKVVSLTDRRLEPCTDVVEVLEDLLARARAGEVRSLIAAGGADAGDVITAYASGDGGRAPLVYALRRAEHRLMLLADAESE